MKVKLGSNIEVEYKGNRKTYFKDSKVIFECVIPRIRETCSFIILYSKNFDFDKTKKIVEEIEKISFEFNVDLVFVVGSESDAKRLSNEYRDRFYKCGICENSESPIFSSFKSGLRLVSPNTIGAVLILGSRAVPDEHALRSIIESLKKGSSIVVPLKEGKRTHPIAFNRAIFQNLIAIRKEKGIPYVLKNYEQLIDFVEI